MAIKSISFDQSNLLNKGILSFEGSNVITIVGMNGSGKSILLNHLKANFQKGWLKQIVLKEEINEVEKNLKDIFSSGKDKEIFKEFFKNVKTDEKMDEKTVRRKIDDFIWERFISSYKNTIENNFDEKEANNIIEKIMELKENHIFSSEIILEECGEIEDYVQFQKFDDSTEKINEEWAKHFNKTKLITIDMNKNITTSGEIIQNSLNTYSLSTILRNSNFFLFRLLRVMNFKDKDLNDVINGSGQISDAFQDKMNDWFKSYISQELKIKIELIHDYYGSVTYQITFWEGSSQLQFENLSLGTQNIIKIMTQINEINSETVIQMDEPESGMHPIMQIQFRDFLEDMSKEFKGRFIIYTHSNHIVKDGHETKGLYVMSRKNGKSTLYSRNDYVNQEDILDFQIFESIGFEKESLGFNFDKNKKTIIVEGETDVIYVKKMMKLLNATKMNVIKSKTGGATNIEKTKTYLEAIHDIDAKNIILSPDKDIETKHPKTFNLIKNHNYFPIGTSDVESWFSAQDSRWVARSGNENTKMNKANLFWRTVETIDKLSKETIDNFSNYFKKLAIIK